MVLPVFDEGEARAGDLVGDGEVSFEPVDEAAVVEVSSCSSWKLLIPAWMRKKPKR